MLQKRLALIVLIGCFCVTNAIAGPFGLEMGMSLKDIGGEIKEESDGVYELQNVPKPHSAFFMYTITVAPKAGLCEITASGNTIEDNPFGSGIRYKFEEIQQKLDTTYGKHKLIDKLLPGSIWSEPKDWMMGLLKEERYYLAVWEAKVGASLPSSLKAIILAPRAISINEGKIIVQYRFTNLVACEAELAAKEDGAL